MGSWQRRIQYGETGPSPSQLAFHQLSSKVKGFSGPVGSGKSKALCFEGLRLAYRNPGCMGLIGAPTYPMLRDVTRAAFLSLLEDSRVPHRFVKSENCIHILEPKSLVVFRSLDKPVSLVGMNLAWFGVDELTYTKEDAWKRLEARLREPKAKQKEAFGSWTPKGFDWVWRRFISAGAIPGYAHIRARRDNPAVSDEYYEGLKHSYDERFYLQEVEGEYLSVFAGRVYYAFERAANVKPLEFDRSLPLVWSLDFNVNPMCSVLAQIDPGKVDMLAIPQGDSRSLRVIDEIVLPDSNTESACDAFLARTEALREKYGFPGGVLTVQVFGDPAGNQRRSSADKTDWRIIRQFASRYSDKLRLVFDVPSAHPSVKGRVNAVNALLKNTAGECRLLIDPRCRDLIADMEQVAWKTDAAGNTLNEIAKSDPARTHVSDALGYAVEREFGLKVVQGPQNNRSFPI